MRTPVIAGNWKMHKTVPEARALARAIRAEAGEVSDREVVLAPPYTALAAVAEEIRGSRLELAAQDVHWEPKGAFTGEISIPMLEDSGCSLAIVGHSERRQYFGETDETVNRRVRALVRSQAKSKELTREGVQVVIGDLHDEGAVDDVPVPLLLEWIEESYRAVAPAKLVKQLPEGREEARPARRRG